MNLRKLKYKSNLLEKRLYLKSKVIIMTNPSDNNTLYKKWLDIDLSNMQTLQHLN